MTSSSGGEIIEMDTEDGDQKMIRQRYHLNVAGPFYVEDGACGYCQMAPAAAPDIVGFDEKATSGHCYFKKQPETSAELEQAIMAIRVCEFRCLYYAGSDTAIIEQLVAVGEGEQCDTLNEGEE